MKKITSIFAVGICLFAVACAKAEPKASTITRSEIAAAQLINANDDLGHITVYFEEIDLKTKAYDLTAPYTQTIRAGFKQGFANVEFVSAPMSTQEMKEKNIQAQIQLKKPTVVIEYRVKENFLMTDFKAFATLKGTLFVNNQTGALQQKILSITKGDEVNGTFIPD
ncbi:MAG: putative component of type VI protein secretion system, partial [Parvibaculaceae bacterium]